MTNRKPLGFAEFRDRSLEAYKDGVRHMLAALGGDPDEDDLTEEEWIQAHAEFWAAADAAEPKRPGRERDE